MEHRGGSPSVCCRGYCDPGPTTLRYGFDRRVRHMREVDRSRWRCAHRQCRNGVEKRLGAAEIRHRWSDRATGRSGYGTLPAGAVLMGARSVVAAVALAHICRGLLGIFRRSICAETVPA